MANYPVSGLKYSEKNIQGVMLAEAPTSFAFIVKGKCNIGFLSYAGNGTIYNTGIGRFCSIAPGLTSGPTNHPTDRFSSHLIAFQNYGPFKGSPEFAEWVRSPELEENDQRVEIGNDVWIGRDVIIKRGIVIGDGAVIGAGSVVTKDVAPYSIVGGVPAKLIRFRFADEIIKRLVKLQWYNYRIDRASLPKLDVANIEKTLDTLEQAIENNSLKLLKPKIFKISNLEFVEM